ncbi:hypothetical protein [Methylobacterium sp. E-046]|uniref:hypothetical protein n=1 Tax=Methylobacterium sp. E-046 TaxID=2836576 RepID=UPI001FB88416|nr:hypothetical protein [Methylobacterium sp. E-046]MCJ2102494.1 hypothetical protein [Methylobacterium sp. E-046]
MATNPTVSELRKVAEISDQEVDAAVDAVLAHLATEAYPLAKGLTLDLVETIRTYERAAEALKTEGRLEAEHGPDRDLARASGERIRRWRSSRRS